MEGGRKLPSALDPAQERKLAQLEEEKRRLEEVIEEKERTKRASLREWERLERESKREGLKASLAEESLGTLAGEAAGMGGY